MGNHCRPHAAQRMDARAPPAGGPGQRTTRFTSAASFCHTASGRGVPAGHRTPCSPLSSILACKEGGGGGAGNHWAGVT